jgi:hypothetical protein
MEINPFVLYQETFAAGELQGTTVRAILSARLNGGMAANNAKGIHPFLNVEILTRDALGAESWKEVHGEIRDYVCARLALFYHKATCGSVGEVKP